ncbi:VOC family protein [soil metagenome]
MTTSTPSITPFLWFDNNALEAAKFYCSIFPGSKVISESPVVFELQGHRYLGFDGGPHFKFNEAFSLFVDVKTQEEVDTLWEKLLAGGGTPSRCGWLKDRFGLSWQIIPEALPRLMNDKDPKKAKAVVDAMMTMSKIDIQGLQKAWDSVA